MKKLTQIIAVILIICSPKSVHSNPASINGNSALNVYNYQIVGNSLWGVYPLSMNNFLTTENYKIIVGQGTPVLIENLQISIGTSPESWNNVISGENFNYNSGDLFNIHYNLLTTAQIGQTQLIQFSIYKKNGLFNWEFQTTFQLYITITCQFDLSTDFIPSNGYEVLNNLSVFGMAFPNGGVTKLDAGLSVTLLPGFYSNISGGGYILILNDGCGGLYRHASLQTIHEAQDSNLVLRTQNEVVKIHPNPTNNLLNIELNELTYNNPAFLTLSGIDGKVLSTQKISTTQFTLNLSEYKSGIYFISVYDGTRSSQVKVIKLD